MFSSRSRFFVCLCHFGWNHRVTVYSEDCLLLWLDLAAAAAVFVREFMCMHFDHHQHQHHHHHPIAMHAFFIFALAHFFLLASPNNRISVVFALNTAQCSCIPYICICLVMVLMVVIILVVFTGTAASAAAAALLWLLSVFFTRIFFLLCTLLQFSTSFFPRFVFKLFASLLHSSLWICMANQHANARASKSEREKWKI